MRFQNLLTASASLLAVASARIVGIAVPETVRPGDNFGVIVEVEDYIQSVADVAIAFGIAPYPGHPGFLGTEISSSYLGPDKSNTLANYTEYVTLPYATQTGQYAFSAAAFSLYGASAEPTVATFLVDFTVGSETSTTYVSSSSQS